MNNNIDLGMLLPDFFSISGFPQTPEQLSAVFVLLLLIVFTVFCVITVKEFIKSYRQISWVFALLNDQTQDSVAGNRQEFIDKAEKESHQGAHQWSEFDETLIEVELDGTIQLQNTIDSNHFFNSSTLAGGITESRMLAAVPGFLTALGVIGTFVGLTLGLSHLNLGNDVEIAELRNGLAHVISGATIAFMTSVWGVFLSVLFNFVEKLFESSVRKKIHKLQIEIDHLFQRLSVECQLQRIADNSDESRESLQGLAEKIGDKMQESLLEVTSSIQSGLEASLEKIMAPAINKLVDVTSDGNQKALDSLIEGFMDKFGEQGAQQRQAMDMASSNVSDALQSLDSSMANFIDNLEESQNKSEDREKELITIISAQVNKLVDQNEEQGKVLTDFFGNKLGDLSNLLQEREQVSSERDEKRQKDFIAQTSMMKHSSEKLLARIDEGLTAQAESTKQLLEQGKVLQNGVNESVEATLQASISLKESSVELNSASQEMKVFGSNIKEAGNRLSGAVTNAVESTSDLAQQNQMASELIEKNRLQLLDDRENFSSAIERLQSLLSSADSSFDKMRQHQDQYLAGLKDNVAELSKQMTTMLTDYSEQVNSQTNNTLTNWAKHTTNYANEMTTTVNALSNIVDEIEVKLGS